MLFYGEDLRFCVKVANGANIHAPSGYTECFILLNLKLAYSRVRCNRVPNWCVISPEEAYEGFEGD